MSEMGNGHLEIARAIRYFGIERRRKLWRGDGFVADYTYTHGSDSQSCASMELPIMTPNLDSISVDRKKQILFRRTRNALREKSLKIFKLKKKHAKERKGERKSEAFKTLCIKYCITFSAIFSRT